MQAISVDIAKKMPYYSGMARPKKDPKLVKGEHLRIPVTEEQKQIILEACAAKEMEMAPWAREILVKAAEKVQRGQKRSR